IDRHYYADIKASIASTADRDEDVIISVPGDRVIRSDFGRKKEKDLSTREQEIVEEMFPLDIVLDPGMTMDWQMAYMSDSETQSERLEVWKRFYEEIVSPFLQYQVPTIQLAKSTPKEAVCQVFEKVNTGGVTLTVFELLTATYAADDFNLRDDWAERVRSFERHRLLPRAPGDGFPADRDASVDIRPSSQTSVDQRDGRERTGSLLQAS
ncbi:MAG: hypothetical protein OXK79_09305, partial [Chloroflexota bacterium]|nr:hypothetical protein [Chloroflexota bacterium]